MGELSHAKFPLFEFGVSRHLPVGLWVDGEGGGEEED